MFTPVVVWVVRRNPVVRRPLVSVPLQLAVICVLVVGKFALQRALQSLYVDRALPPLGDTLTRQFVGEAIMLGALFGIVHAVLLYGRARRFELALARLRDRLEPRAGDSRAFAAALGRHRGWSTRLAARSEGRIDLISVADIHWIEAAGNYVSLHLASSEHIMRETLKALEARLDPAGFTRIHRSAIVNIDQIARLESIAHGEYLVTLRSGKSLYATRSFAKRLRQLIR